MELEKFTAAFDEFMSQVERLFAIGTEQMDEFDIEDPVPFVLLKLEGGEYTTTPLLLDSGILNLVMRSMPADEKFPEIRVLRKLLAEVPNMPEGLVGRLFKPLDGGPKAIDIVGAAVLSSGWRLDLDTRERKEEVFTMTMEDREYHKGMAVWRRVKCEDGKYCAEGPIERWVHVTTYEHSGRLNNLFNLPPRPEEEVLQ